MLRIKKNYLFYVHLLNVNEFHTGKTKVNSHIIRNQVAYRRHFGSNKLCISLTSKIYWHFLLNSLKRPPVKSSLASAKTTAISFSDVYSLFNNTPAKSSASKPLRVVVLARW